MSLNTDFVTWFRSVTPYINTFRGKTFVIAFSGEMVANEKFVDFIHDINLLASLGVRLVLAHGASPQINARLKEHKLEMQSVQNIPIIDSTILHFAKESIGRVHLEIEALLSMGLPNSPMANATIQVTSGNFITARPIGIVNGIDLLHSGKVRKVNTRAIHSRLEQGDVVLISPLGYSPTGEIFHLTSEDIATEVAIALNAEKLIFLSDTMPASSSQLEPLSHELTVVECKSLLEKTTEQAQKLPHEIQHFLLCAIKACETHVHRTHLISRHIDGAIIQELFTHHGIRSMISQEPLQSLRNARIEDVGSILQLIEPLETEGILVRRNRELLEIEIDRFTIFEHDGMIIGCAALYPFPDELACELACLAMHPDYRNLGHGNMLLKHIESKTVAQGYNKLFVLTTRATHWFIEHGYLETELAKLPKQKKGLYNYQRRSKVFTKNL